MRTVFGAIGKSRKGSRQATKGARPSPLEGAGFARGAAAAIPVVLGYLPIGFAFGTVATQSGLSLQEMVAMSLVVYAGASQFIAAGMLAAGAPVASIILTTFLVNLRHLLMGASLSPYLRCFQWWLQALISFGITDETFAVSSVAVKKEQPGVGFFLGLHLAAQAGWVVGTLLGGLAGYSVGGLLQAGLEYALVAMFIGLLVLQLAGRPACAAAIASGIVILLLAPAIGSHWGVVLAAVAGATVGLVVEQWMDRR